MTSDEISIMAKFIQTRTSEAPDIVFLIQEDVDCCWRWLLDNKEQITEFDRNFIRKYKFHWIDRI